MNRIAITGAALAALFALPAAAQVAGTYSGASANGDGVTFTVGTDTGTGVLAVQSASIGFSALCRDGSTLNSGWGYGMNQDIAHKRVSNTTYGPYFTIKFTLKFSADNQSATGTVSTVTSSLSPIGPAPKKVLLCRSPIQALNVTLQPATSRVTPPPAKGAVWLGGHD